MDIVSTITSYAKAVPAGLKAAGQELAKTASAMAGADDSAPSRSKRRKTTKKTARRGATAANAKQPKATRAKAKRPAAKPKRRKARR